VKPITAEELLNALQGSLHIEGAMPLHGDHTLFEALEDVANALNRARLDDHRFQSRIYASDGERVFLLSEDR
jgi:hypothetical protein